MSVSVRIIEDSISMDGARITTLVATYPRYIHAQVMTHRMFSRNAASSRAIPVKKMLAQPIYMPPSFGINKAGMSADEVASGLRLLLARTVWKTAGLFAFFFAWLLSKLGLHKQIVNRGLEPYTTITTLITSTDWQNFLAQRLPDNAQPEIRELALAIQDALLASYPQLVGQGGWHLPFITEEERKAWGRETLGLVSAARCARVSYLNHDQSLPSIEKDIALAYKLLNPQGPAHMSVFEHVATPLPYGDLPAFNLRGWGSLRYYIEKQHNGNGAACWEAYVNRGITSKELH